jgi:ComF family protein
LIRVLIRLLLTQRKSRLVFNLEADAIVPVPRHWTARLFGGLDHVAMIAEELAHYLGLPFRPKAVRRVRLGHPQRAMPLSKRFQNARLLYALGEGNFEGQHLVVVDDVITSGATASVIAELLKKAGAKEVTAVAIARAEGPGAVLP